MPKVEIRPGVEMAYEDHWFGKPWNVPQTVVMVHGNSESSRAWTPWVPHLSGKYRVVRPDLPGFGASAEPPGFSSSPDWWPPGCSSTSGSTAIPGWPCS